MNPKQHFEGIDGLRGIAAIAVILFHLYPHSIINLGWAGVDFFFVISGFLITNILINQKDNRNYFKVFYIRRSIRIFPVYFLVVTPFLFLFIMKDGLNLNIISYFLYFQNFTAIYNDYLPFLGHTWSLAIEEQFYLIFPVIVYFTPIKKLKFTFILLIFLSILLRWYFAYKEFHIYFQSTMLFSRADSLLFGGLLPVLYIEKEKIDKMIAILKRNLIIGIVLLIIFIAWQVAFLGSENFLKDFGNNNLKANTVGQFKFTILGLIFSAIVGIVAYDNSLITLNIKRILESKILKDLGKISYGLYLFHYPILNLTRYLSIKLGVSPQWYIIIFINLLFTIIVSKISWKFFEEPILRLKSKFNYN